MDLTKIFYGEFVPPTKCTTRRHRIMYVGGPPPKPYVPKMPRPNEQVEYAEKFFQLIKENPGICCNEASALLKKAPSYIYRLRDILLDQRRIEGVRGKPIRRGGPKTTLFYEKDHAPS